MPESLQRVVSYCPPTLFWFSKAVSPRDAFPLHLTRFGADRFHGHLCDSLIGLPITSAHTNTANALTVEQDRHSTLHGRPAGGAGGQSQSQRMRHVKRLTDRAFGAGLAFRRRRADRLRAARMDSVEWRAVHAIK